MQLQQHERRLLKDQSMLVIEEPSSTTTKYNDGVGSKIAPSGNNPEASQGGNNPEASQNTTYPSTGVLAHNGSTIVDVNTSHSIEKYPEDNTI
jgi:hypothetical protein